MLVAKNICIFIVLINVGNLNYRLYMFIALLLYIIN